MAGWAQAKRYQQDPQPKAPLLERAWAWLHATFPERQIYIRSDGRVQFFTFGPSLQATLAGLTLIFLGWVAFATVNVIFKDRIIAAKDHRYQQMQAAYENRVADLQMSYDELNGALVSARRPVQVHRRRASGQAECDRRFPQPRQPGGDRNWVRMGSRGAAPAPVQQPRPAVSAPAPVSGAMDVEAPADFALDQSGSSALVVMPGPAQPQPRTARPVKSSALDRALQRFAALYRSVIESMHLTTHPAGDTAAAYAQHPGLRALAEQTDRVARIGSSETLLMAKTEGTLEQGIGDLRNVMRKHRHQSRQFARRSPPTKAWAVPKSRSTRCRIEGISDSNFTQAYLRRRRSAGPAQRPVGSHATMCPCRRRSRAPASTSPAASAPGSIPSPAAMPSIPASISPAPGAASVHATAPGVVVFAGNRGGYGNMVEIDHGYGIHTRYGHLSAISVQVGTQSSTKAPPSDDSVPRAAAPGRMSIMKSGMTMS